MPILVYFTCSPVSFLLYTAAFWKKTFSAFAELEFNNATPMAVAVDMMDISDMTGCFLFVICFAREGVSGMHIYC